MRLALFVALALSLTALLNRRAVAAPLKVACVGDSITQNSGWSDKLGAKLGAGYTSTNYGVSGTTLLKKGDNPYWTTPQFTQSHSTNPDIVVIMLGTNDSKAFNWNAHKGEFVGDYEALIDTYAALPSHPRIYLNLCPPAGTNGFQISGAVIENEILPDLKQIAAAKGVPTIDVFAAFGGHTLDPSLYGSAGDQVHPNAKGAQVIADTVYAALVAVVMDGGTDGARDGNAVDARGDAAAGGAAGTTADAGSAGTPDATAAGGAAGTAATGAGGTTGAAGTGGAAGNAGGAAGTTGASGAQGTVGAAMTPVHKAASSGCALAGPRERASAPVVWAALAALALVVRRRRAR